MLLLGFKAPKAALTALLLALLIAVGVFKMPPAVAAAAAVYGACYGLMPIGWIVLTALFLYNLTVRCGQFEVIEHSVAAISPDRRMQALLIAFCFGSFLEGCAGFGIRWQYRPHCSSAWASRLFQPRCSAFSRTRRPLHSAAWAFR